MIKLSGNLNKYTTTFTFTGSSSPTAYIINHNLNTTNPIVSVTYVDGITIKGLVDAFQDAAGQSFGYYLTAITPNSCTVNTLRAVGGSNPVGTYNATVVVLAA